MLSPFYNFLINACLLNNFAFFPTTIKYLKKKSFEKLRIRPWFKFFMFHYIKTCVTCLENKNTKNIQITGFDVAYNSYMIWNVTFLNIYYSREMDISQDDQK